MILTKSNKSIIMKAFEEARWRWDEAARNSAVVARAPDGAWPMPKTEGARREALFRRRLADLEAAAARLDILPKNGRYK